jgi:hypothetical protein
MSLTCFLLLTCAQTLPQFRPPNAQVPSGDDEVSGSARAGSVFRKGAAAEAADSANQEEAPLLSTGGHTLGGATRRSNVDPRSARLQAVERRAKEESNA